MHLNVRLPKVQPQEIPVPTRCPWPHPKHPQWRCPGTQFKAHQQSCRKAVRDPKHVQVMARRYRCLTCQRTFRVYPPGVSAAQHSDTLKALSVLLYLLGLSYQGVSDLLDSLEHGLGKTTVYHNVQAAGQQAIQLRQQWLAGQAGQIKVLGMDCTHVKRLGQDRIVAVATAILTGQPLTFDLLDGEGAVRLEQWIRDLAQTLGAEILVTDDADGMKSVAEQLGLQHQVCRAHVNRNVHDLIADLGTQALEHPDPVPVGLTHLKVEQFLDDLDTVEWIIKSVPHDGQAQLEQLWERYRLAPPPTYGHRASMWYRLRRLTLDWAENWARLSLFQTWRSRTNRKLDGTNNVTEQVIGQNVKERYRTMRGYKRDQSILNVSSLLGWIRMQGQGYSLAEIFAN
jgi:transposase-like protein